MEAKTIMRTPRLLDLFCGAGGAAHGYRQAGFHVTGIDHLPQPRYAGDVFVQHEAVDYLAQHGQEYDVIHASPPCQRYSRETPQALKARHSDVLEHLAPLLQATQRQYVIENVEDARRHLRNPWLLCGTMFGLPIWRHRRFEVSIPLAKLLPSCDHRQVPVLISGTQKRQGRCREYSVQARRDAIQCPWMTDKELDQAIPPAYTHWIGQQLRAALEAFLAQAER